MPLQIIDNLGISLHCYFRVYVFAINPEYIQEMSAEIDYTGNKCVEKELKFQVGIFVNSVNFVEASVVDRYKRVYRVTWN